jgi:hypothetical protein
VKEIDADADVRGTAYDVADDTGIDVESSHLRKEFVPFVAAAPMLNDSDLETLNVPVYEAETVPTVNVRAAPDGFDANVTETVSVDKAKFAVNVAVPV